MQATHHEPTKLPKLQQYYFTSIPKGSIVFFRVVFGLILFWEVCHYFDTDWIGSYFINPNFHFKYYGFSWVRPWSGDGMYYHFAAMGICALCMAFGFLYRITSVLTFLLFTYIFFLDQTGYLNHYYFVSLLLFIMMFVPANRTFSVDTLLWPTLKEKPIHRWTIWLLRFQIGCVYIFGGIAKINPEWLRGEPMRGWLGGMEHFPLVGNVLASDFTIWAFSYGGILFDLGIVWVLLYKPTRTLGLLLVCFFHLSNVIMFHIGIFPWLMLFATPLFFAPDWPHRLLTRCSDYRLKDVKGQRPVVQPQQISVWQQQCCCWLIIIFVSFNCLMPLRHYLYPGNVSWTDEGHRFSWRMKLRNKAATIAFYVKTDQLSEAAKVDLGDDLEPRQINRMAVYPDMMIQYAHLLLGRFQEKGHKDIEITVKSQARLNDRPLQIFVDPKANLADFSRDLKHRSWIVPLESRTR